MIDAILAETAGLARAAGCGPVTVVAAAKTQSADTVRAAIAAGITVIGENRAQEMLRKHAEGAYQGAALHFIGHLQRNKVRDIIGIVDMIQSLDSPALAEVIDREAQKINRVVDVLIQVKTGGEESKYGFEPESIMSTVGQFSRFSGIRLRGLMTIPPPSNGEAGANGKYFSQMRKIYVDIRAKMSDNNFVNCFDVLSMGMSGDWRDAIAAGSSMIRLGTALFGQRRILTGG